MPYLSRTMSQICFLCLKLGSDLTPQVFIFVHHVINYTNSITRPEVVDKVKVWILLQIQQPGSYKDRSSALSLVGVNVVEALFFFVKKDQEI